MATATFPGVFNFMTLRDHSFEGGFEEYETERARYLHVFDGGNADNLGLTSLKRVIWKALKNRDQEEPILPYRHIIIIQVDAFVQSFGADPYKPDPRGFFDYIFDLNFASSMDSLLEVNRDRLLTEMQNKVLFPFGRYSKREKNTADLIYKNRMTVQEGGNQKKLSDDPEAIRDAGYLKQKKRKNEMCIKFFYGDDVQKYCSKGTEYWDKLNKKISDKLTFVQLNFDKVPNVKGCVGNVEIYQSDMGGDCLKRQLNRISTNFMFKTELDRHTGLSDGDAIACAVPLLFGESTNKKYCGELNLKSDEESAEEWEIESIKELAADWENVRAILKNDLAEDANKSK